MILLHPRRLARGLRGRLIKLLVSCYAGDRLGAQAQATNPFATHIPVLVALQRVLRVRHAVEFGSGRYSTRLLLDQKICPALETLYSYENDPEWHRLMHGEVGDDARLRLALVAGDIADAASGVPLNMFDLVFIDDSKTIPARLRTILQLRKQASTNNVLVIHDIQTRIYFYAMLGYHKSFVFDALNPETGVFWVGDKLNKRDLDLLNQIILQKKDTITLEDVAGWHTAFDTWQSI